MSDQNLSNLETERTALEMKGTRVNVILCPLTIKRRHTPLLSLSEVALTTDEGEKA